MSTSPTPRTARRSTARRVLVVVAGTVALAVTSFAFAGPASASVPEGWPIAPNVDELAALGLLVGMPVLLFVGITVAVYLPAMVRGEQVAPGAPAVADQWLGGPSKTAGELAAPDSETSQAGGASGRW